VAENAERSPAEIEYAAVYRFKPRNDLEPDTIAAMLAWETIESGRRVPLVIGYFTKADQIVQTGKRLFVFSGSCTLATALGTSVTTLFTFPGQQSQRRRVRMVTPKKAAVKTPSSERHMPAPILKQLPIDPYGGSPAGNPQRTSSTSKQFRTHSDVPPFQVYRFVKPQ